MEAMSNQQLETTVKYIMTTTGYSGNPDAIHNVRQFLTNLHEGLLHRIFELERLNEVYKTSLAQFTDTIDIHSSWVVTLVHFIQTLMGGLIRKRKIMRKTVNVGTSKSWIRPNLGIFQKPIHIAMDPVFRLYRPRNQWSLLNF